MTAPLYTLNGGPAPPAAQSKGTGTNDGPLVSPVMGLTHMAVGRKRRQQATIKWNDVLTGAKVPNCDQNTSRIDSGFGTKTPTETVAIAAPFTAWLGPEPPVLATAEQADTSCSNVTT